eukprot:scaffold421593_cov36-Prasinocladus_malaysianus.AAC.1
MGAVGPTGNPTKSRRHSGINKSKGALARRNRQANTLAEIKRLKEWLEAGAPPRGSLGLEVKQNSQPKKPALAIGQYSYSYNY